MLKVFARLFLPQLPSSLRPEVYGRSSASFKRPLIYQSHFRTFYFACELTKIWHHQAAAAAAEYFTFSAIFIKVVASEFVEQPKRSHLVYESGEFRIILTAKKFSIGSW